MTNTLFTAVQACDQWRVKFLLNRGVRINLKDTKGENILVTALRIDDPNKRNRMFRWLLSKGADIFTISRTSGKDMLIWASYLNRPAEVDIVLNDAGGELDLRRKDFNGQTALHYAIDNGCCTTVEALCRYMRKFDIPVDVVSGDGLTPFLLARRLGRDECAHILQDIGQACPHMGDARTGQSEYFWESLGGLERSRKEEEEKNNVVALYKQLGRLPQLKKARYNTDHIKLVQSQSEKKAIEDQKTYKRHKALEPLDLSTFNPSHKIISSKINNDHDQDPHAPVPQSVLTSIHQYLETDTYFKNDKPHIASSLSTDNILSPRMMGAILDIASEQGTHTFKPPAKSPKPIDGIDFKSVAHATRFGVRLKRKSQKPKENRKLNKDQCGTNFNKDHLPVLIVS